MAIHIRRREFIFTLGGAAAAWPLAARAQQGERMRRIGVLMMSPRTIRKDRPAWRRSSRGCSNWAGPTAGNVQIDYRWAAGDTDRFTDMPTELLALAPDVILAVGHPVVGSAAAGDPHRADCVRGGRRPGRRGLCREPGAAGRQRHRFYPFEYGFSAKWLELLKEIAPA